MKLSELEWYPSRASTFRAACALPGERVLTIEEYTTIERGILYQIRVFRGGIAIEKTHAWLGPLEAQCLLNSYLEGNQWT
jgi:hypothetical protein